MALAIWILPITVLAAKDKDHPLVGRYEGSELFGHKHSDYDEADLINGPIVGEVSDDKHGWVHVEGENDFYYYKLPAGRSTLEVLRNYEMSLKDKGFDVTFTCATSNGSCYVKDPNMRVITGPSQFSLANDPPPLDGVSPRYFDISARYLLAKLSRPEGAVYVSISFSEGERGNFAFVHVVATKEMEEGKIKFVGAGQMHDALSDKGRISLYGIQFDFDKDVIKPESKPTLDEIAKLLRADPELRLAIVGHTDKQGTADYNVDLSKRRAESVVAALTNEYAIAASRLSPHGAGASEPLASNDTDEGRAKNRRVELVKQ
ncbi:MAG: OmpA family protein [Dokdonella sp.]